MHVAEKALSELHDYFLQSVRLRERWIETASIQDAFVLKAECEAYKNAQDMVSAYIQDINSGQMQGDGS